MFYVLSRYKPVAFLASKQIARRHWNKKVLLDNFENIKLKCNILDKQFPNINFFTCLLMAMLTFLSRSYIFIVWEAAFSRLLFGLPQLLGLFVHIPLPKKQWTTKPRKRKTWFKEDLRSTVIQHFRFFSSASTFPHPFSSILFPIHPIKLTPKFTWQGRKCQKYLKKGRWSLQPPKHHIHVRLHENTDTCHKGGSAWVKIWDSLQVVVTNFKFSNSSKKISPETV